MKTRFPNSDELDDVNKMVEELADVLERRVERADGDLSAIAMFYSAVCVMAGQLQKAMIMFGATQQELDYVLNYNLAKGSKEDLH